MRQGGADVRLRRVHDQNVGRSEVGLRVPELLNEVGPVRRIESDLVAPRADEHRVRPVGGRADDGEGLAATLRVDRDDGGGQRVCIRRVGDSAADPEAAFEPRVDPRQGTSDRQEVRLIAIWPVVPVLDHVVGRVGWLEVDAIGASRDVHRVSTIGTGQGLVVEAARRRIVAVRDYAHAGYRRAGAGISDGACYGNAVHERGVYRTQVDRRGRHRHEVSSPEAWPSIPPLLEEVGAGWREEADAVGRGTDHDAVATISHRLDAVEAAAEVGLGIDEDIRQTDRWVRRIRDATADPVPRVHDLVDVRHVPVDGNRIRQVVIELVVPPALHVRGRGRGEGLEADLHRHRRREHEGVVAVGVRSRSREHRAARRIRIERLHIYVRDRDVARAIADVPADREPAREPSVNPADVGDDRERVGFAERGWLPIPELAQECRPRRWEELDFV